MTFRQFLRDRFLYKGGFPAIATRVLWQMFPSVVSCALFWYVAFVRPIVMISRSEPPKKTREGDGPFWIAAMGLFGISVLLVGACMNAVVTLANGGYMPVGQPDVHSALWVTSTEAHRLRFLGDNYWGFSLGDFAIVSGFLIVGLMIASDRRPKVAAEPEMKISGCTKFTRVYCALSAFLISPGFMDAPLLISGLVLAMVGLYVLTLYTEWQQERVWIRELAWERYKREGTDDAYAALARLYDNAA